MKNGKVLRSMFLLVGILIGTYVSPANAEGFYVTAEFGLHSVDEDLDVGSLSARLDDTGSLWRIGAGYELTDWFAVEVGYVDFGSIEESALGIDFGASADGKEISLIGRLPIGRRLSANLRGGYIWWNGRATAGSFSSSLSDRDVGLGLGLEYLAYGDFVLGLNVRKYRLEDFNTVVATLGVRYRF